MGHEISQTNDIHEKHAKDILQAYFGQLLAVFGEVLYI